MQSPAPRPPARNSSLDLNDPKKILAFVAILLAAMLVFGYKVGADLAAADRRACVAVQCVDCASPDA